MIVTRDKSGNRILIGPSKPGYVEVTGEQSECDCGECKFDEQYYFGDYRAKRKITALGTIEALEAAAIKEVRQCFIDIRATTHKRPTLKERKKILECIPV